MDFVLGASDIEDIQFVMDIYPNPSAGATTIEYGISKKANVQVAIYNHTGQLIRLLQDDEQLSGAYSITLEEQLPKGLYFVNLKVDDQSAVRKLIIH